jgi:hypothetical protein
MESERRLPDPDTLREAWDRLVRGERDDLAGLDAADAAVLHRLHALYRPPGPDPAFVAHLEEEIMIPMTVPMPSRSIAAPPMSMNGRVLTTPQQRLAPRSALHPSRLLAHVTLAALLVLTLIGSYLAFWPHPQQPHRAAHLPAVVSSPVATPGEETAAESLLAIEIAAEWLPPGQTTTQLIRIVIDPGVTTTRPPGNFPAGVRIDYVVTGSYTVQSDGALMVMRGAGERASAEEVAPGTDVLLAAGDAVIHQDNAAGQVFGNPGTEPAVVLFAVIAASSLPSPPSGITAGTPAERVGSVEGPVTVELRRTQLGAEERLPGPRAGIIQLIVGEPGSTGAPSLAEQSDGAVKNLDRDSATLYVLVLTPAGGATPTA